MSYFQSHYKELNLLDSGLRECQLGAFWATCAHFTSSNSPALIVMPTGSGKTAVMMLLAFGLKASRILVIEPAVILKDQTAMRFRSLDDLIKAKVLSSEIQKPRVHSQEGRITSEEMWENLRKYDVVVATPHTISPEQHEDIVIPPKDIFDIVFFDEAHHTPARTWDTLLRTFKDSKCILLTATPFRKDKLKVRAHLVYNYPLGRAIDHGIYRPIQYHPVATLYKKDKDKLLCDKVKELLINEKNKSFRTKILIRTNRVGKCKSLIDLYRAQGINVGEINYQKSLEHNSAVLDAIKHDQLDGIVCVGMLGEGLDIPELKIAVFHDPPQSFPFTLQFIGRISRPAKGQIGDAHVIANPDDVKGEMRRLYRQDIHWRDLIPELVEEAIGQVAKQIKVHHTGSIVDNLDIDPREIAPFFSARLYKIELEDLNLNRELAPDLGDGVTIKSTYFLDDDNLLVVITEAENKPPWAERLVLYSSRYDLHIYYYHRLSKTLFESTTSDGIAGRIRRQIVNSEPQRLGSEELARVMKSKKVVNYLMVGLASVLGRSPSLPAYKILMGKEVEGAIKPTEGRVFRPGHALAKISELETRGIGNFQGRVWAIKRASLIDYKNWCDNIGDQLVKHGATSLPGLAFLPSSHRVKKFQSFPIAVLFNYEALSFSLKLLSEGPAVTSNFLEISYPEFEVQKLNPKKQELLLRMYPNQKDEGLDLIYSLPKNQWDIVRGTRYIVKIDTGQEVKHLPLNEFLLEYPPFIYLGDGGVVINGELHQPNKTFGVLPKECFIEGIDWSRCDITVEFINEEKKILPSEGKKAIHDWLEEKLITETEKSAIILKDHGRGEIADFIVIKPKEKTISFYHCKSSENKKPGARIKDLKVLEQAFRSIIWIRKSDLLSMIVRRATSRQDSIFVKGNKEIAENVAKGFLANEWDYQVIIVQPGLDCNKAVKSPNIKILLLTCYEWLFNIGASLLIMGYDNKKGRY